jgi:hypothetical protein
MNEAYASGDGLDPQVILFGDSHFQFLRAIPPKENILEQSRSYSASQRRYNVPRGHCIAVCFSFIEISEI